MAFGHPEYHMVFSTKERRRWLQPEMLARLTEYIGGIARTLDCRLLACGGTEDHLHLALIVPTKHSLAEAMRALKAGSSKWIHETFADARDFAWQDGYAVFTVSHSMMPAVTAYIANQAQHHRAMSFTDELIALLEKHEVQYDPKYIGA